jgi:O-antigen/teichoic acid export membrane protein
MSHSAEPAPPAACQTLAGSDTRPPARWARLAGGGAASVGEQALFAGTHLLINVMLARWLPIEEYGVFALVYSVVVFLNALHTAMVAEPVAVFWGENLNRTRAFVGEALSLNLAFAAISAVVGLAGAGILVAIGLMPARTALLVPFLAVAMPTFWYVRQAAYADLRPWAAFTRSAIYGGGFVLGVVALKLAAATSMEGALAVMGAAALVASLGGSTRYWARPARPTSAEARRFVAKAWTYGRWSAPAGMLTWVTNNIYIVALPFASTVADSGRLKMVLNLLLPFQQVLLGLSLIGLPMLARMHSEGRTERAAQLTRFALAGAVVGGGVFSLAVALGGEVAFAWIYGPRHRGDAQLVLYGVALPVIWAVIAVLRVSLRARGDSRSTFLGYSIGIGTVGLVAVPLGITYGAPGALLGSTAISAAIAATLFWRATAGSRPETSTAKVRRPEEPDLR